MVRPDFSAGKTVTGLFIFLVAKLWKEKLHRGLPFHGLRGFFPVVQRGCGFFAGAYPGK